MDLRSKSTNNTNTVDAPILSSNHKVIHYLQNSTHCSNDNRMLNPLIVFPKTSDLCQVKESSKNNLDSQQCKHRLRSCSDNGSSSSSSVIDTLSRSDLSLGSSLSDPGGHFSNSSSNTSSSGICSTSSDIGHEESASTSSEDLDFNLGFDQISDNDDIEIANLNEIDDNDQCEDNQDKIHRISTENNDTATLFDIAESNIDTRISELEELLRNSYNTTNINDDNCEINNDDTITLSRIKQQGSSFLHDSTHTLCPQDYSEDDEHENEFENNKICVRSNSLGIVPKNRKSILLEKPPKKVVRFADMLGLDLESIRYMTPPDQSTNSLIQECIRIKLEQLRLAKAQSNFSSSPLSFDYRTFPGRLITSTVSSPLLSSQKKFPKQYNLVSKYFTPPTNIIPLIYQKQILLECLYTKDAIAYGTVRVHNCAYEKYVFVRITENEWMTTHDIQAWHSMNYINDKTDAFVFEIRLGKYNNDSQLPKQIHFAVCVRMMSQEFWDNNRGWNYVLDIVERR